MNTHEPHSPSDIDRHHPALLGSRVVLFGVLLNLVLAFVKGAAGYFGNSSALMADAVESAFDVVSSLVLAGSLRIAARPPDRNHPYGHGKAEPLAGVVVSGGLFAAAGAIVFHALHEIQRPHNPPAAFTLIVLVAVILTKEFLSRWVRRFGERYDSSALRLEAWHHRSDAITSIAAFLGISIAVFLGGRWVIADEIAAICAACVIFVNAVILVRPAVAELSDASPPEEVAIRIRSIAADVPGVLSLDKCFVRKMGIDLVVDIHVVVDGDLSVRAGHDIAHRVKDRLRSIEVRIREVMVHVEPGST